MKPIRLSLLAVSLLPALPLLADHVILDDCIIDGSLAVGLDAVNGENFGFDTIRIKENNLRFHFDDTSVAAAFPRNDWRLIANDSANGGDSYLAIEDSTAGRIPFRTLAGAPSNSLYIDSQGDVGLGTNNPVVELHISDGDTPTVRLEQNGTSGWNPQTWDVAGNETNFFIRDVTNGSKLPFRIRPDAPTSSIEIEADGEITMSERITLGSTHDGAAEPRLDMGADYSALKIGETFLCSGDNRANLTNNSWSHGVDGTTWSNNNEDRTGGLFQIKDDEFFFFTMSAGAGPPAFNLIADIDNAGNLTTDGTVNGVSDRNAKKDIVPVNAAQLLKKVLDLPIAEWSYIDDENAIRHVGPMSQDFHAKFGLGKNDKTISFHDPAGVALAAIQGLNEQVEEKDHRILELEKANKALEKRLERIEKALLGAQ